MEHTRSAGLGEVYPREVEDTKAAAAAAGATIQPRREKRGRSLVKTMKLERNPGLQYKDLHRPWRSLANTASIHPLVQYLFVVELQTSLLPSSASDMLSCSCR